MTTYTIKRNQSYKDVVLQCLGSMEAAGQFCQDNGVSFTSVPPVGAEMLVSDKAIALAGSAGAKVVASYVANGVLVGNLNLPPVPVDALLNNDGDELLDNDGEVLEDNG
jgi:hypothetical protein